MTLDELKVFCATEDDPRSHLRNPWTRDGYTWASNGRIIVRVPALADVPENHKAPSGIKLFNETLDPIAWVAVPQASMPGPVACEWCDGTGKDCDDRRFKCDECSGAGRIPDYKSNAAIGDVHFALRYLALIQGWEIAPNGTTAAWIRRDDALGLLMPMRA